MALFTSKRDILIFVCDKSVRENKPFFVDKTIPGYYLVKCTEDSCMFKMLFRGNLDGVFQLVEQQEHNCQALEPTIRRAWVREKVKAMILENPRIKPKQIQEDFFTRFNVNVNGKMVKNAIADVKMTKQE